MNEPERRTGGEVDIDAKVGAKFLLAMVGGLVAALLVIMLIGRLGGDDTPADDTHSAAAGSDVQIAPIDLSVDTGQPEGEPTLYELPFAAESTLLELMQAAGEPTFEHRGEGQMAILKSIGGVASDVEAELFWRFYVNDQLANEGFGAYVVQPGDVILWKREKTD